MEHGVVTFLTDYGIDGPTLARAVEERGLDAVFLCEHTHIPTSRQSAWHGGAELPRRYSHTLDPFVALAAVATVTERLRVGTGICLVVERDPITTAKEVASVDLLSNGRFEFGVGAGWNREEMRNHGTDPATRFSLMRERVEAMKAIWSQEEASYHGKHVSFDRIWSWPKPVQQPHPPILVGGTGPKALDRALGYGDVWMPNRVAEPAELKPRIAELRERAGRHFPVTYFGADPTDEFVSALADAGVDRALLQLPDGDADTVLPLVEQYAELAARHR
jgi:probable F420-dependent oxidoreductase